MTFLQLPSWACSIRAKRPDVAEQESVFEFLISSPVHAPASYRLYPKVGLLATDTQERQDNIITTRLQACSKVRTLLIQEPCAFIVNKVKIFLNKTCQ